MARITVEDCVTRVPNRFELILLAAHRARELSKGYPPTVDWDDDKSHVVALREIAEGTIDPQDLVEGIQTALLGGEEDAEPGPDADDALTPMEASSKKIDWDRAVLDPEEDAEDAEAAAYGRSYDEAMNEDRDIPGGFEDVADEPGDLPEDDSFAGY